MTSIKEVIQNIVHNFNLYVDTVVDIDFINEEFMKSNATRRIDKLFSVTGDLNLSKDFTTYFINYLIDLKYDEHLKIFYKKNNLTSQEIVYEITKRVIKRSLDYHCFKEEITDIRYDPKLDKWDTVWLTDIPERVIINLLSDSNHSLHKIIGMANIDNYNKLKDFKDLILGFNYLRDIKDYESIAYLLTRNFGRYSSKSEMANVKSNNEFNISHQEFEEMIDSIKHESIHAKYKHAERFIMMIKIYNLSKPNYLKIFNENYNYAIEKYVKLSLYDNKKIHIMDHIFKTRRRKNLLCKQITNMAKMNKFKEMKYK